MSYNWLQHINGMKQMAGLLSKSYIVRYTFKWASYCCQIMWTVSITFWQWCRYIYSRTPTIRGVRVKGLISYIACQYCTFKTILYSKPAAFQMVLFICIINLHWISGLHIALIKHMIMHEFDFSPKEIYIDCFFLTYYITISDKINASTLYRVLILPQESVLT